MRTVFLPILLSFLVCGLFVNDPVFAAAAPAKKATPKKPATASKGKTTDKKNSAVDPEKLQKELDMFAQKMLGDMNKQLRPGIQSKEVFEAYSGGYTARYLTVDPDSLKTSYSPADNPVVKFIGRVMYHEVEYTCTAPTKAQALAGPFNEVNRSPVTELIKHMKGKWTF